MILKTYPNKNLYGKYFLAMEAPDDEEVTEDQPKPKRNVKIVTVKPSNRGKDFAPTDEELQEIPEETPEETEPAVEPETDETDYATEVDQPVETPETTETEPDVETEVDAPDMEDDDTTDFSQTDDGQTEQPTADVDTDTEVDAPDTGDSEDFSTDDTGDVSTDVPQEDATATQTKPNAPGVELDSTRKYNLYKEYMSLYNACDNYISKLENVLLNNDEENQIIRISVTNLREIKDILADYMTIRFQINSYVQSILFYQKMVVAVQLVFNLLKSINKDNNSIKSSTNKKSKK